MQTKTTSRRRTSEGEVVLVKVRDTRLLVKLREASGLSQRQTAVALDISHGHYADIEGGRRQPSLAVGQRMAQHFEVSLDALFEELPLEWGDPA